MVTHCANNECQAPFRYLSGGRLFHFAFRSPDSRRSAAQSHMEHFWLCSNCALTLTLKVDGGTVLTAHRRLPAAEDSHVR